MPMVLRHEMFFALCQINVHATLPLERCSAMKYLCTVPDHINAHPTSHTASGQQGPASFSQRNPRQTGPMIVPEPRTDVKVAGRH